MRRQKKVGNRVFDVVDVSAVPTRHSTLGDLCLWIINSLNNLYQKKKKDNEQKVLTSTNRLCKSFNSCWDSSKSGFSISGLSEGRALFPSYRKKIISKSNLDIPIIQHLNLPLKQLWQEHSSQVVVECLEWS